MIATQRVTWQDFRTLLRMVRERHGLSQEQLAKSLGCHRSHIWRLENGIRRPSKVFLYALARTCALTPTEVRLFSAFELLCEYRCEEVELEDAPKNPS